METQAFPSKGREGLHQQRGGGKREEEWGHRRESHGHEAEMNFFNNWEKGTLQPRDPRKARSTESPV